MALNDLLKKIEIPTIDCKGLYFKDIGNIFKDKKVLNKKDLEKIKYENIDIVLKLWFRSRTIKKTLKYHSITGLAAVKKASIVRSELKEELEDTGTISKTYFKSLNELFTNYMIFKGSSLSTRSIYTNQKTYDKWIKDKIGDMEISKITTFDIQPIINKMLQQGLAPRTAQSIKQILRPVFNYAIDLELCNKNPAIKINLPKFDNTIDFQLTDVKRKKLYEEIKKYEPLKYRGIMLFLYFGRRQNEVLTLKWQNINFDQGTYIIEDIYSKIRRRQEYPLLKPLSEFLLEFGINKTGYIFQGETTKYITRNTFRNHWKILLKNSDIEKMRIHDTRHLLGNTMVNKGQSLEAIGKVLGHSSTAVTRRYAKTTLDTANDVLNGYMEE